MSYIDWHYFHIWPKIILLWRNLTLFPIYYFSIPLHLKTLFSPWKRQIAAKKRGFYLEDIISVLIINLFSRIIGAIVKSATILYGLIFAFLVFLVMSFVSLLWPLTIGLTLPIFLALGPSKDKEALYLLKRSDNNLQKLAIMLFKHPQGQFVAVHLGIDSVKFLFGHPERSEGPSPDGTSGRKNASLDSSPAKRDQNDIITIPFLFKSLSETYKPLADFLSQNNLKSEDVYQTATWYEQLQEQITPPLIFDLERIKSFPGIGANWIYAYTVSLDKFSSDLTKKVPVYPLLIGRDKELGEIERVLLKTQGNNVLIVGEPGTSRHILIETFAYRVKSGNCPPQLTHKRILNLNMHSINSSKPSILEVKGLLEELLQEAEQAGNIILVINDFDKYVGGGTEKVDFSDVLVKFAQSKVAIIGITSNSSYNRDIAQNSNLAPLFEAIKLDAPTRETVLSQLQLSITPVLEEKNNIIITYQAILKTLEDADRFISHTPYPAKAIDLLDSAVVYTISKKGSRIIKAEDIDSFLSEKFNINLGEIQRGEKDKLIHLEELIHKRIINQEEAIRVISSSLRRARLEISSPKRPIGSFLFLGPTGVGKTETAKALAEVYFGSEERMLRFDMSQYQKEEGLERLIGSMKLAAPGELTAKLSQQPFSLLLLDEFEKAEKDIFNLFLTLLDEGYITDSLGKKINAKNTIIIATSNAGSEFIRQKVKQDMDGYSLQKDLIDHVQNERIFSPELLNRFDSVVVFAPLSEGHLREVAKLMLGDLNRRLIKKEISVDITADLIKKLANIGFDPQFGARAMRRVITEKIEDQLAQKLLRGEVEKGQSIQIQL